MQMLTTYWHELNATWESCSCDTDDRDELSLSFSNSLNSSPLAIGFSDFQQVTPNAPLQIVRIAIPQPLTDPNSDTAHQVDGAKQRRPIRVDVGAGVSVFQIGPHIWRQPSLQTSAIRTWFDRPGVVNLDAPLQHSKQIFVLQGMIENVFRGYQVDAPKKLCDVGRIKKEFLHCRLILDVGGWLGNVSTVGRRS